MASDLEKAVALRRQQLAAQSKIELIEARLWDALHRLDDVEFREYVSRTASSEDFPSWAGVRVPGP